MTSSLPEPGDPSRPERLGSSDPAPQGSTNANRAFDEILRETSNALIADEPLTATEKQAFEDVASRFRGRPFVLETVVSELVFTVLKIHLPGLPDFEQIGRSLSDRVARTLIDDPTAKFRLESLWSRLQGGQA